MKRLLIATPMLVLPALLSSAQADVLIGPGDKIVLNAILNTTDPNENGEGEPLVFTANGFNIGVVFNYAIPATLTYTAPPQVTNVGQPPSPTNIAWHVVNGEGDETASVSYAINPPPPPVPQPDKSPFAYTAAGLATLSGAFWTIDFFCAAVTAGVCGLAGTPIAALSSLAAGGFALLAVDPVDMNYKSIATPQNVTLPGNLGLLTGLATDEVKAITVATALLTSINRYQGAVAAGDLSWQQQQLAVIQTYLSQLSAITQSIPADLRDIVNSYVAAGMSSITFTPSQVLAAETQLARSGLPQSVIDFLNQFDLTSTFDINSITQNIFVQDVNSLSGQYPDILARIADELSGAAAIPEPSSLLLMGAGAIGLFCFRRRSCWPSSGSPNALHDASRHGCEACVDPVRRGGDFCPVES